MTQAPDNGAGDKLKAYVERLETLRAERADLNSDIRDVMKEAKDDGFDGPTIQAVLKRREMSPEEVMTADGLLETYEQTLGCGAAAGGVLQTKRGADGVFQISIAAPPAAEEKLSKATQARRGAMALAEMARRAREAS